MFTLPGILKPIPCPRCADPKCGGKCQEHGRYVLYCETTMKEVSPALLMAEAKRLGLPLRRAK